MAGTALRLAIAPSYGYLGFDGDLHDQKLGTHLALTKGFHEIYLPNARHEPGLSGRPWDGGYFGSYGPVTYYLRGLSGLVYRHFEPDGFDLWNAEQNFFQLRKTDLFQRLAASRGFTVSQKLPGIVFDGLLTAVIFCFVSTRSTAPTGLLAAAAYAFNPGVLFDTAFWGQHDGVWLVLVIAALYAVQRGWLAVAWALMVLAVLTKPQAIAFGPLVAVLSVRRWRPGALLTAAAAAVGTFLIVFLPFLVYGTFIESLLALYYVTFSNQHEIACFACNIWWLFSLGRGCTVMDWTPLVGPITARAAGLFLFAGCQVYVLARLLRIQEHGATQVFLGAAVIGMGFFTLSTEMHENHMAAVLPMTLLALPADRRLWALFAVASATFFLDMLLFDPPALAQVNQLLGANLPRHALSMDAAAANVLVFLGLVTIFTLRTRRAQPSA